jgi:hypothetical protein
MVYDMAQRLLQTCQAQQGPWQGAWLGELAHAAVTLAELQPARVRWFWQAGEVRMSFVESTCRIWKGSAVLECLSEVFRTSA